MIGISDDPARGILTTRMHSDGSEAECLAILWPGMAPGREAYVTHEDIDEGRIWPTMEGQKVFKNAVKRMPGSHQRSARRTRPRPSPTSTC